MNHQCGYIGLLGLPNAGKSTLLNSLVGQKIAGVSRKPQTTRNQIAGIVTTQHKQFVFLDTPGYCQGLTSKGLFYQKMHSEALRTMEEADMLCYLMDLSQGVQALDEDFLAQLRTVGSSKPLFLLLTKADMLNKVALKSAQTALKQVVDASGVVFQELLVFSSKRPADRAQLMESLGACLPEGPWLFAEDDLTNRPSQFIVSELIREKVFRHLGQELPFKVAVVVEAWEETSPSLTTIFASLVTERANHKPMLIGRKGAKLKAIGEDARKDIESLLGKQIFLRLNVRHEPNWTMQPHLIAELQGLTV